MRDAYTRIDLAQAGKGLSDWEYVAALSEADIARAIAGDADTFAADENDLRDYASLKLSRIAIALKKGRLRRWARPLRRSELRALAG